MNDKFKAFAEFNATLESLGFASYREYLLSELWKDIRRAVFDHHGETCVGCRRTRATQIHHKEYTKPAMLGENLNLLVPLCGQCHKHAHAKRNSAQRQAKERQEGTRGSREPTATVETD